MPTGVLVKRIFVVKQTKKNYSKRILLNGLLRKQALSHSLVHKLAVKKAKNNTPPLIGWHKLNRISKES